MIDVYGVLRVKCGELQCSVLTIAVLYPSVPVLGFFGSSCKMNEDLEAATMRR